LTGRRRWAWLAAGLLLLAFTARAEPFIDAAGRAVEPTDQVAKVLAAGPPAAVMIYTLVPGKLLGWTSALDDEAKAYVAAPYRDLPVQLRLTGRAPVDPAAIKTSGANLIVDFGTVNADYSAIADRTQSAAGIPYVLIDGALAKTAAAYRDLGRLVQAGPRADLLAARSQAMLDEVTAKVGALPRRTRVYVARGPDGDETYGAGAFTDEIIKPAAGDNVAADWGRGRLKDITPARVRDGAPDVVIATDPHFLATVARSPAWRQVPAIAAGRLYVAPRHPFGWLDEPPSVNRLIGLRWLAQRLHPERFDGDERPMARDFYRIFYQVELSSPQLDRLLADAGPNAR
jgi:iron complex transport system substrate-binding protein